VAITLPPGYGLGHVHFGRGNLWGVPELNLERRNAQGVSYRTVMSNFFFESERCLRLGVPFDAMWELPGLTPSGYREVVRIREDGKVEVAAGGRRTLLEKTRQAARPEGEPPALALELRAQEPGAPLRLQALARVTERAAPVYYTHGTDPAGVYHNAMVLWELFGPGEEDYRFLMPENMRPVVRRTADGAQVEMAFAVQRPGRYRLRAATADEAGRTRVVWQAFEAATSGGGLILRLNQSAARNPK
jgi:hypothetical protein